MAEQATELHEDDVTGSKPPSRSLADVWREAADADVPLGERLAMYRTASSGLRPDFAKAYDEMVARLAVLDRGEVGPQVGERLAEFQLPDEQGRLVSLSSLLESGPAVISINRGHWCPYCKLELRSLAAVHDQIKGLGASIVSIMPDVAEYTGGYSRANELPFPLLSDVDLGYSLSLGLIFWIGAEVRRLYEEAGLDLGKYHRGSGYFLPVTAKFVVGQDGLVKARRVNVEFRQRMEPEAVVATLRELNAA
jgi:peroxiredoxin